MMRSLIVCLAFLLTPVAAGAQSEPMPPIPGAQAPTAAQQAAMQQWRAQVQASRLQTRARLLAALTPAHRAAVANVFGQLALAANPDPRAAAQLLDSVLAPAEKQSIVAIAAAQRANMQALMQQQRAFFESTLTADQRARQAQHEAQRQAFMQSHPRGAHVADPGAIVLRTLGSFGGPAGMHEHMM